MSTKAMEPPARYDVAPPKRAKVGDATKIHHPLHQLWRSMVRRCHDPNFVKRKNYAGRVTVCDRWRGDFWNFVSDIERLIGSRPSREHSLDRRDNDGHYEPGNVRWATRSEQARNTRCSRLLTANGRTMVLEDWAIETGLAKSTIFNRLCRGWSDQDAVTLPPRVKAPNGAVCQIGIGADCATHGIARNTVESRVRRGWSYERALSEPSATQRGGSNR